MTRTGPESPLESVFRIFIEFKAVTIFSFLFGVGIGIQSGRGRHSGTFLIRRFLVLLLIGIVHATLIWNGDILVLYAICGLLVIPLLRLQTGTLAILGALIFVGAAVGFFYNFDPSTAALKAQGEAATRLYAHGTWLEILQFRWEETVHFLGPLTLAFLPRTVGLILLGVAAWRADLLTGREELRLPIFLGAVALGFAGNRLDIEEIESFGTAFALAVLVLMTVRRSRYLAAAGQMALTNYLTQSLVFSFVFYGFGLGLMGKLSVPQTSLLAIVFYVFQILFSRLWLDRFCFGPAEWLWRSLTYGQRQPMRNCMRIGVLP